MGATKVLPRSAFDVLLAALGLAISCVATWVHPNPLSDGVAGPAWLVVIGIYALEDRNIRTLSQGELWAGAFFGTAFLATWLVGVFVRTRREESLSVARTQALEAARERAVTDERARIARELHDVVSHNLSVVVVQAAGARAAGGPSEDARGAPTPRSRRPCSSARRL